MGTFLKKTIMPLIYSRHTHLENFGHYSKKNIVTDNSKPRTEINSKECGQKHPTKLRKWVAKYFWDRQDKKFDNLEDMGHMDRWKTD